MLSFGDELHLVADFLHQLLAAHPFVGFFSDEQRVLEEVDHSRGHD